MTLNYTEGFLHRLDAAPKEVQKAFLKQARFLERNLLHPSLRAKKYDETRRVWQARVNKYWRFYFRRTIGNVRTAMVVRRRTPRGRVGFPCVGGVGGSVFGWVGGDFGGRWRWLVRVK